MSLDDCAKALAECNAALVREQERNAYLLELLRQAREMIDRLTENDPPGYENWKALDDSLRAALEEASNG